MSDPAKSASDIDDVLSSIRRLVAEKPAGHNRAEGRPLPQLNDGGERLVLTQALRVSDSEETSADDVSGEMSGHDAATPLEGEPVARDIRGEAAAQGDDRGHENGMAEPADTEMASWDGVLRAPEDEALRDDADEDAMLEPDASASAFGMEEDVADLDAAADGNAGTDTLVMPDAIVGSSEDDAAEGTPSLADHVPGADSSSVALNEDAAGETSRADDIMGAMDDADMPDDASGWAVQDSGADETPADGEAQDDADLPAGISEALAVGAEADTDGAGREATFGPEKRAEPSADTADDWDAAIRSLDWDIDERRDETPSQVAEAEFEPDTGDADWPGDGADRALLDLAAVRGVLEADDDRGTDGWSSQASEEDRPDGVEAASGDERPPVEPNDDLVEADAAEAAFEPSGLPSGDEVTSGTADVRDTPADRRDEDAANDISDVGATDGDVADLPPGDDEGIAARDFEPMFSKRTGGLAPVSDVARDGWGVADIAAPAVGSSDEAEHSADAVMDGASPVAEAAAPIDENGRAPDPEPAMASDVAGAADPAAVTDAVTDPVGSTDQDSGTDADAVENVAAGDDASAAWSAGSEIGDVGAIGDADDGERVVDTADSVDRPEDVETAPDGSAAAIAEGLQAAANHIAQPETAPADAQPGDQPDPQETRTEGPGVDLAEEVEEDLLDEETLRRIVAEVVREELQGALGERITRNVRKLVRREIRLVLAADELD